MLNRGFFKQLHSWSRESDGTVDIVVNDELKKLTDSTVNNEDVKTFCSHEPHDFVSFCNVKVKTFSKL